MTALHTPDGGFGSGQFSNADELSNINGLCG
jgi:hypothetical protein